MARMEMNGRLVACAVGTAALGAMLGAAPTPPPVNLPAPATIPAATLPTASGPAVATVGGLQFSPGVTAKTAKGDVTYYGQFSNETFTVTAPELAKHEMLEIEADLIVTLSMDGSIAADAAGSPNALGPDYIRVALSDGRVLMNSTFSNAVYESFSEDSKRQNYPSQVPGESLPAMSGAAARNTLGFVFSRQSDSMNYPMDATYHLHFVVPHTEGKAAVTFTGYNLQEREDENWCVANVKVTGKGAPAAVGEEAIEKAFAAALKPAEGDAAAAFRTLVTGMDGTAAWVEKHVTAEPINAAEAGALIEKIAGPGDEGAYADAQTKLAAMGPQAEVLLRDAVRKPGLAAEGRDRLEWQLQVIGVTAIEDVGVKRVMLASRALELIGTPKALEVRKALTQK
jgi:hypothetical protein